MTNYSKSRRVKLPLHLDPMVTSERQATISTAAEPSVKPRISHGRYCESLLKYDSLPPIAIKKRTEETQKALNQETNDIVSGKARIVNNKATFKPTLITKPLEKQPYIRTKIEINYRKALEPKVLSPFEACEGKTPRLIEIERKKRMYLSLDISRLVFNSISDIYKSSKHSHLNEEEMIAMLRTSKDHPFSMGLPLEIFDNNDYDPRTENDWLDVSTIPDDLEGALQSSNVDYPKVRGIISSVCPQVSIIKQRLVFLLHHYQLKHLTCMVGVIASLHLTIQ
jgi:hypothetical protein